MSDKRLLFIRGHIDALKHLCEDLPTKSLPVKTVGLLKEKVESDIELRPKEEYYRAGFEATVSLAGWVSKMVSAAGSTKKKPADTERALKVR